MKKFFILVFVGALIPFIGFAHEGHGGTDGYTITHYFVEQEHAIYTWSFLMASFILISYYRLKRKRNDRRER
jgi:membrane protein DedA with SNARE-associated domain